MILKFLFFSLLSVTIMVADHRSDERLSPLKTALSILVYPLQYSIHLPFKGWESVSDALTSQDALLAENQSLKKKVLEYETRLQEVYLLRKDNGRLHAALKVSLPMKREFIFAELIRIARDPSKREVLINRGSDHSVYVGQPVIAGGHEGGHIYGQVLKVSPKTSTVMLISDLEHEIPVVREDGTLRTVAAGTGHDGLLEIRYVSSDKVKTGDLFRSSGLGGIYPEGFPVGRVVDVAYNGKDKQFLTVRAEPLIDLGRVREMLLVSTKTQADDLLETPPPPKTTQTDKTEKNSKSDEKLEKDKDKDKEKQKDKKEVKKRTEQ